MEGEINGVTLEIEIEANTAMIGKHSIVERVELQVEITKEEMDQSKAVKEKCLQMGTTEKPQTSPCQKKQIRQTILEKPSTNTIQHQTLRK